MSVQPDDLPDDLPGEPDITPLSELLEDGQPLGQPSAPTSSLDRWKPKYAKEADRPFVGDPWDRQPHETAKAHAAFIVYRELPPDERTVVKAHNLIRAKEGLEPTRSHGPYYKWSSKHRWEDRAAAYDAYMAAKTRARLERRKLKVAEEHADQMEDAIEVFATPVKKLADRLRAQSKNGDMTFIDKLTDEELLKLARSMTGEVPGYQKAQREALSVTGDAPVPKATVKAKGELLRAIVGDPTVRAMVERITLETKHTVEGGVGDGTGATDAD